MTRYKFSVQLFPERHYVFFLLIAQKFVCHFSEDNFFQLGLLFFAKVYSLLLLSLIHISEPKRP
ncbi:hypothetical protein KQJ29_24855, partial [Enterococcus sp. S181_ASV_20]|nr:hypothetical protein [Enterococcus sp. S181_ASV_20]